MAKCKAGLGLHFGGDCVDFRAVERNSFLSSAIAHPVELPITRNFRFSQPCSDSEQGAEVQFRLIYRGQLPPAAADQRKTRSKEKHHIRKQLHKQLAELWKVNSILSPWLKRHDYDDGIPRSRADIIASNFSRCGFRFLPLVTESIGLSCSLDILFLRRDDSGNLIQNGGDIDNRIKVFFDALRVPKVCDEIQGFTPEADEDPLYCLLEDDYLINEVNIRTDRLLLPTERGESENDVVLITHVRTVVMDASKTWPGWGL